MKTDFLVIGSGAAGLSFALKAAEHGHVTLVTKGKMDECNTNYAQGGICSVTYAPDTFEKHIHDTLVCGAGKCDPAAVELVVRRAPELIRDLIAWGTKFDKTPDGRFELNREGGHTEHRILHHEDLTGAEIERALITSVRKHPNITVLEHHFAIDLLTQHHLGEFVTRHTRGLACFGAYVLNLESNEIETVLAKFTVVAAGGCGNVYSSTTNPSVATGDGIAMCHRAKAITENMEFIQFHPTSLYHPAEKPNFLITEAMRGYGAILRLQKQDWHFDWKFAWEHLRMGLPMAVQFSVLGLGMIFIQAVCNKFGPTTIAAFTSAMRIEQLALQPMISFGLSMAVFSAQNFGAHRFDRIREGVKKCSLLALCFSLFAAVIMYFFGREMISIFISEANEQVLSQAQQYLHLSVPFYFFLSQIFIYRNAVQGMGIAMIPMFSGIVELILRTSAAVYLTEYFDYSGICYASPIAWLGSSLFLFASYHYFIRLLEDSYKQHAGING